MQKTNISSFSMSGFMFILFVLLLIYHKDKYTGESWAVGLSYEREALER